MLNFLLAWNPRLASWPERMALMQNLRNSEDATTRWGLRTKAVEPGDQLFFIRLGKPPKGIFARATAISASYRDYHWDETKKAQRKTSWYVDVQFRELLDPETETIIDISALKELPFKAMHWSIQGSGTFIPAHIAEKLEIIWQDTIEANTQR